eukprot:2275583-Pleurochrysis_carterae.AAC.3
MHSPRKGRRIDPQSSWILTCEGLLAEKGKLYQQFQVSGLSIALYDVARNGIETALFSYSPPLELNLKELAGFGGRGEGQGQEALIIGAAAKPILRKTHPLKVACPYSETGRRCIKLWSSKVHRRELRLDSSRSERAVPQIVLSWRDAKLLGYVGVELVVDAAAGDARHLVDGVGAAHVVAPLHVVSKDDERAADKLAVLGGRVGDGEDCTLGAGGGEHASRGRDGED